MDNTLITADRATVADAAADGVTQATADQMLEEELLVEEISIDGMCGVY